MATRAGVGMSRHHNPNVPGREAAQQALQNAGIAKADFVFIFAYKKMSTGFDRMARQISSTNSGARNPKWCSSLSVPPEAR
jgi:hypothetical protein